VLATARRISPTRYTASVTAPRAIPWGPFALEGAWALLILVLGSDAGLTVPALILLVWGAIALLGIWLVRWFAHLIATRKTATPKGHRRWLLEPALVLACGLFVWFGLAFRVRFLASKPALDRYVREVGARASDAGVEQAPMWVGLFRVRETEVLAGGVVRLITTPCMFDDCGVVYSPTVAPPRVGEDTYSPLVGGWWHWWRSW